MYDGDRNTLLEEAVEYRSTINLLDTKINDLTSQVYMLKEQYARSQSDMIDKENKLNEYKKMYNAKRLEFDALQKTTHDQITFYKKKIDQQQKTLA